MTERWIDPSRILGTLKRRAGSARGVGGRVEGFREHWGPDEAQAKGLVTVAGDAPVEVVLRVTPTRVEGDCPCGSGAWPCVHLLLLAQSWAARPREPGAPPGTWRDWIEDLLGTKRSDAVDRALVHWIEPVPGQGGTGLAVHWRLHRVRFGDLGPGRVVRWERLGEAAAEAGGPGDREVLRRVQGLLAAGAERAGPGVRVGAADVDPLLRSLARAGRVYDQRSRSPLRIDDRPVRVRLRTEGAGAGIRLRAGLEGWEEGSVLVLGDGPPWVLGEGLLRPVAGVQGGAALTRLLDDGVALGEDDIPSLVGAVATDLEDRGIPVDLDGLRSRRLVLDERPRPRLYLEETDGRLWGRLGFRYGDVEIAASNPDPMPRVAVGAQRVFVRRDMDAEFSFTRDLDQAGLRPVEPGLFSAEGEAALAFMTDGVLRLGEGWEVLGAESLVRWRVRAKPVVLRVRVRSGVDWLEVEADAGTEGHGVSLERLVEALRSGARFVRLDDGSYGRIAEALRERGLRGLEDLRLRGGRGRLPIHMGPVLDEVAEAAADVEWEGRGGWARVLQALDAASKAPPPEVPGLRVRLRPYQAQGVRWLVTLGEMGCGAALADDMGLGKTVQALAAVAVDVGRGRPGPNLVVAPTSVVPNWEAEARRFLPGLRVLRHHGADRAQTPQDLLDADLVITSYALLRRDRAMLEQVEWNWVILDEAQAVKNPDTQTARAARALRAKKRAALTGTPLENHLGEIWSLFQFLNPGLLGSQRAFVRRFVQPVVEGDPRASETLRRRIAPFVLRRLKEQVEPELPPKVESVVWCDMDPVQEAFYRSLLDASRRRVLDDIRRRGLEQARFSVLEALLRLRQACCLPELLPGGVGEGIPSAKFDRFQDVVTEILEEGHRVLVFSQFTQVLSRLRGWFREAGVEHLYLDGRTRRREEKVRRFQEDESVRAFLISLKAGGAGLNLTGADYVILFDPWWNPAVEEQATDRVHRIGQTRKVFAYRLVVRGTVEEKILELQARKKELVDDLLRPDRPVALTEDTVWELFGGGPGGEGSWIRPGG
ncbi:DEAD/DEAH box helicase [Deferrisoma camini]|uniref:DEAD/DEAH box helicase n=1 Tax=Deferrisoma camini TaxID=1035120 RepID=UPI00046D87C5|nr:DEAD/DEAH box helicase [Deferrisoma camini]